MGSFATSLHVKSSDSDGVASELTKLLAADGWQPTQQALDPQTHWPGPSTLRGLQISTAREGWVSVLDSDLMSAHQLAPALAKSLSTHAIFFFVNDSDSWSYLDADPSGIVSEFDSDEGADEEDDNGELVEAGAAIEQIQSLMRDGSVLQKFQQMQSQMLAAAPPEIRAAETRIKSGQGTAADMRQYQAWAMQEMPKHMADMKATLAGLLKPPLANAKIAPKIKPQRQSTNAERRAQQKRLDQLRPLFADGVTDEQVQVILDKRAIFAEEVLREFLPLLGIADYYANLSYRYLGGAGFEELAAHNIRFVNHLRFETSHR